MAHKTLVDGTAYEISGGKTLIDGTGYEISKGNTLVDGTAYEIGFVPTATLTITGSNNIAISMDGSSVNQFANGTYQVDVGTELCIDMTLTGAGSSRVVLNGKTVWTAPSIGEYSYKHIITKNTSIERTLRAQAFPATTTKYVTITEE